MATYAAFFDLDRTLIAGSSATVYQRHLAKAGLASDMEDGSNLAPLIKLLQRSYETFGESWTMMQLARASGRAATGWDVEVVEKAATDAATEIVEMLQPFAVMEFEKHRAAGALLVLATTSPRPWIQPLADALGFDALLCTDWQADAGTFTGQLAGPFLWGPEKAKAARSWAKANDISMSHSFAYSDSYFDTPLLDAVGKAVAINPDPRLAATAAVKGWPIRHLDKSPGVAKIAGREIQEWTRPLMRPELVAPGVRFTFEGVENIPADGPALLVFNHRSYFDPTVLGLLSAKAGRPVRGLGKKEVFDVPVVGNLLRALGGIRVERASGSDEPLKAAAEALTGGEIVMMAPQGTIPRGPVFFDPVLKGRWGAAKLAAMTGVPVIPVGLWGTEHVWPRNSRLPLFSLGHRPEVSATVGTPVDLPNDRLTGHPSDEDLETATEAIMSAIVGLLPALAREPHTPSAEELARTYPPGYAGDPEAEAVRRPGTDT